MDSKFETKLCVGCRRERIIAVFGSRRGISNASKICKPCQRFRSKISYYRKIRNQKNDTSRPPLSWENRLKLRALAIQFINSDEDLLETSVSSIDNSPLASDLWKPKIQFERAGKLSVSVIRLFLPDGITEDRINSDALADILTERSCRIDCEMPLLPTSKELNESLKYEAF